jgi:hypothetical protein
VKARAPGLRKVGSYLHVFMFPVPSPVESHETRAIQTTSRRKDRVIGFSGRTRDSNGEYFEVYMSAFLIRCKWHGLSFAQCQKTVHYRRDI